jgi:DNA-binding NarL/FixJ family response regulator
VRVGLRKILEAEPETPVVGEAGDGEEPSPKRAACGRTSC